MSAGPPQFEKFPTEVFTLKEIGPPSAGTVPETVPNPLNVVDGGNWLPARHCGSVNGFVNV